MPPPAEPMIKLEPGGTAPILSYNVPEPTSYSGRHVVELDIAADWFTPEALDVPPPPPPPPAPGTPPIVVRPPFAHGVLAARELARAGGTSAAPLYPIEVIVHMVGRGFDPHELAPYIARWRAAQRAYNAWLDH